MATASIHLKVSSGCSAALADYECRKNWQEKDYLQKNQNELNNYDFTRRDLNFAVGRDANGKAVAVEVNPSNNAKVNFDKRLAALNFKGYYDGALNQPNNCISAIISGDHDRLTQIAYGNQSISFAKGADNSHVTRSRSIEQWACDTYDWACEMWGEDNIVGFQCHMDEKTPHIHLTFIPVAERKQRGRMKAGAQRKTKKMVSYKGLFGETKAARAKYLENMHTSYHAKVGAKYGLARGKFKSELTEEEARSRKHKSKALLTAEAETKALIAERKEELKLMPQASKVVEILGDKLLGTSRKRAEDAESARSAAEKIAKRAVAENSKLKRSLEKALDEQKSLSDDVSRLRTYKTKYESSQREISALLEERQAIAKNIEKILPEARKYGLSTSAAISLCHMPQVEVSKIEVNGETFEAKKSFIVKWVDGLRVRIGALLQRASEKDLHWLPVEEWAMRWKNHLHKRSMECSQQRSRGVSD